MESLVAELLKFAWQDKEEAAAEAYISFLANLVSACPCYTRYCSCTTEHGYL